MKYILPVSSIAALVLLGMMVAESSWLQEWRGYQKTYSRLLEQAAAKDPRQREFARTYRVVQRQIVVPELGLTDRCVTCHQGVDNPAMANARQPFRAHPGDLLKIHPVERYGCTTCHRGQGLATTWKDARGIDVYWNEPLLPTRLVESSCGVCHDPVRLADRGAPRLAEGARMFEASGCRSCHKLGGLGGTLGPALDNEGLKIPTEFSFAHVSGEHTPWNWLASHFRDPQGVSPGSQMPPYNFSERQMDGIVTFILAQQAKNIPPRDYLPDDYFTGRARQAELRPYSGEQVYRMLCKRCHGTGEKGRFDPAFAREMPAIRGQAFLETASESYIRSQVAKGRPGTLMGAFGPSSSGLSQVEFDRLIGYVKRGVRDRWSELRPPLPGSARRGKAIYDKNCLVCHGRDGVGGTGNQLANSTFQKAASDAFIAETIRAGRAGTKMKGFGREAGGKLSEQEIGDLVAYIRMVGGRASR